MNRETILRRAAKLAALANDMSSIAEAEAASERLAELLREHRLTMQDVSQATMREHIRAEDHETSWMRAPKWAQFLSGGIATACGCQSISYRGGGKHARMRFIGEEADVAVCRYWYSVLEELLPAIADREKTNVENLHLNDARVAGMQGKRFPLRSWTELREAFLIGVGYRVCNRLQRLLQPEMGEAGASGRALVLVKDAAITDWIKEHLGDIKEAPIGELDPDHSAIRAGMRAGEGIELKHGIASEARAGIEMHS